MRPPPHPFRELLQCDPLDRRLFYEVPDLMAETMFGLLEDVGPIYITDGDAARRVMTQAFTKASQDVRISIDLLRSGHETQAATLASSLMETVYFIHYIAIKPDKAQAWVDHDEWRWSDGFDNWLKASLAHRVRTGEITASVREDCYRIERETYSTLCASKHSNGFALRKTNTVMIEPGHPELTTEPAYTYHSRASCGGTMATVLRLAYDAMRFYTAGMGLQPPPPVFSLIVQETFQIALKMADDLQDFTGQPRAEPGG